MSGRKKIRRMTVKPQGRPNSEINVTPLVDVVLVLLIIFMVVTPLLEKDIDVRVPDQEQVEVETEVPPDQLVVSLDAEGRLKLNSEDVAEAEYVERLTRAINAKAKGEKLVFFLADEKTNYGRLVVALDGAKQAGAETLGMMTEKMEASATPPQAPAPAAP
ncbi:MAG: biopolymer transporter ExbD [Archangiaceae bacterium]|nr:biopolymer transporter ExbD [Archangiaceae bacterium]